MLHVLTTFNLRADVTIDQFCAGLEEFEHLLKQKDMIAAIGHVGRRHRETIMDTNDACDHEYFFVMSFHGREQCDRAIDLIYEKAAVTDDRHRSLYAMIDGPVFSCWEDISPSRPE